MPEVGWWDADLLRETFPGIIITVGSRFLPERQKTNIYKWKGGRRQEGIEEGHFDDSRGGGDCGRLCFTPPVRIYHTCIPADRG